ncbi:MAG: hypothetical protein M1330_04020 [Armatimonadetes bacterium]|nr:hypothetical protein [Armatimonadota bacterium]
MRTRIKRAGRGSALITALFFILIVSTLLMGISTLAVSHEGLAVTESDYAASLDVAEAGINYELRKISQDASNADQYPGSSFSMNLGDFSVYCTNTDGSTPWNQPGSVTVISTGTVDGISRTIKITAVQQDGGGKYAVYALQSGIANGHPTTIASYRSTNGSLLFNGNPTVNGTVVFNGSGTGWSGTDPGIYSEQHFPNQVIWPTVDQVANQQFPDGGLSYVANHNNNNLVPQIVNDQVVANGNTVVTFYGVPGGANYYLTNLILNGSSTIYFDNTNGPITLWFGPNGGTSTITFNGGSAAIRMSDDQSNPVRMYVATTSDFVMNGNTELDAGVYDYNANASGQTWGTVVDNGNPVVDGSIIATSVILNGYPTINYSGEFFSPLSTGYYGFDNNSWFEVNPSGY